MGFKLKLLELPFQDFYTSQPEMVGSNKLSQQVIQAKSFGEKKAILVEHCRRGYFDLLANTTDDGVYRLLSSAFATAKLHISVVLGIQFLPVNIALCVAPVKTGDHDPVSMYDTAFGSAPHSRAERLDRRRFEARRIIEIGTHFFELELVEMTTIQQPLGWITDHLVRNHILMEKPRRKKFITWHDPRAELRYRGISLQRDRIPDRDYCVPIEHRMRAGKVDTGLVHIPIVYQIRAKDKMSILRKRLTLEEQSPEEALPQDTPDILALRLICVHESDLNPLNEVVVGNLPARTILSSKDLRDPKTPKKNKYSATEFKAVEYKVKIFDPNGIPRRVEIQLLTAEVHFNIEISATPLNHRRYEARQLIAKLYPLIAPVQIYQVKWDLPEVKEEIEKHIAKDVMRRRR